MLLALYAFFASVQRGSLGYHLPCVDFCYLYLVFVQLVVIAMVDTCPLWAWRHNGVPYWAAISDQTLNWTISLQFHRVFSGYILMPRRVSTGLSFDGCLFEKTHNLVVYDIYGFCVCY